MNENVNLTGVPETMLWTLHNRASEARRSDGFLRDPDCVRIHDSIRYDYVRSFGRPQQSHAARSRLFDDALRPWLAAHPQGTVVELAAGLETQFQRCDDGKVQWLCVDVPESMAVRERFLPPSPRCRHLAKSALDLGWLDEVDARRCLFITAQGLFMYFHEHDVQRSLAYDFANLRSPSPALSASGDAPALVAGARSCRPLSASADFANLCSPSPAFLFPSLSCEQRGHGWFLSTTWCFFAQRAGRRNGPVVNA